MASQLMNEEELLLFLLEEKEKQDKSYKQLGEGLKMRHDDVSRKMNGKRPFHFKEKSVVANELGYEIVYLVKKIDEQ